MSDEKIEIVIEDKIAPSVEAKIEGIGNAALHGYNHVEKLKKALAAINPAAINALSNAYNRAQRAINEAALSSAKLATQEQRTAAATIQATTAQQKLQTAATQTATAQAQLEATTARLATEQARAARETANAASAQSRAASAALRLEQQQARAARASGDLVREAERLKRELNPLYAAQELYNASVERTNYLFKQGVLDTQTYFQALDAAKDKLQQTTAGLHSLNNAQQKAGKGAQLHRAHLINLGFQLNDIGVSLASGQNPLVVLVQQGSQIAGIASQAGVSLGRLAAEAGKMLLRFSPLAIAVGVLTAGFKALTSSFNEGAGLEKYARDLGATSKQIKQLNLDTVTFGDTMRGLWKTITDNSQIDEFFGAVWAKIKKVFSIIIKVVAGAVMSIAALFKAGYDTIVDLWSTFPNRFMRFILGAVNGAIGLFESFVNAAISGVNAVISAINSVSGSEIKPFENLKLDRIDTSQFEDGAKSVADVFVTSYMDSMASQEKRLNSFMDEWGKNSTDAAKKRIRTALEDGDAVEKRSVSLAKINAQLDNELQRMNMLKPAREIQQKFDQIEEQLLGKKIKLTTEEAAAIREKIAAIESQKTVQAEMDRIYEQSVAPLRAYNDVQAAAGKLLEKRAISEQDAAKAILQAKEAYLNSVDPLRQINKEITQNIELLGMLPKVREVAQQMQQIENQLISAGIELTKEQTDALRELLKVQQQANIVSQAEAAIYESTVGVREKYVADMEAIAKLKRDGTITAEDAFRQVDSLNPELNTEGSREKIEAELELLRYRQEQIEKLHQLELISAEQRNAALMKLNADRFAVETKNAQSFFGALSGLMNSENKKLFKIGKAAALANAVIQGTQSVMNAMAIQPWYVGAALAVVAAANAAQQIAQIKNAKPPEGFMKGGYTGSGPINEVAGQVHRREWVMNAGATARIGRENLQALQDGSATVSKGDNGGGSGPKVNIYNYGTSKTFDTTITREEIKIIARDEATVAVARDAEGVVASSMANPQSKMSKAISRNTNAQRQR